MILKKSRESTLILPEYTSSKSFLFLTGLLLLITRYFPYSTTVLFKKETVVANKIQLKFIRKIIDSNVNKWNNSRLSWKNGIHQENTDKLPFHSSKLAWRAFSPVCNARFLCGRSCIDITVGFACRYISVALNVLICFCAWILTNYFCPGLCKKLLFSY